MTRDEVISKLLDDDVDTFVQWAIQGQTDDIREALEHICGYDTLDDPILYELADGRGLIEEEDEDE